jgi:hypothetical protein
MRMKFNDTPRCCKPRSAPVSSAAGAWLQRFLDNGGFKGLSAPAWTSPEKPGSDLWGGEGSKPAYGMVSADPEELTEAMHDGEGFFDPPSSAPAPTPTSQPGMHVQSFGKDHFAERARDGMLHVFRRSALARDGGHAAIHVGGITSIAQLNFIHRNTDWTSGNTLSGPGGIRSRK